MAEMEMRTGNTTDALLAAAVCGEEAAFRALYDRFSSRLERDVGTLMVPRIACRFEPQDVPHALRY